MNIYITTGFIGSGKSYWSSQFSEQKGALIISKDKIREMIFGKYNYSIYLEALIDILAKVVYTTIVRSGYFDIIVDEVHITREDRQVWWEIARDNGAKANFYIVWFPESENNLNNRMQDSRGTSKELWSSILEKMRKSFEEPTENDIPNCKVVKMERLKEGGFTNKQGVCLIQ